MPRNTTSTGRAGASSGRAASSKTAASKSSTYSEETKLKELFVEELRDILWAEKHLTKALPKMAKAATSTELADAFNNHLAQTEEQIARLEEVFEMMDMAPRAKKCDAMEGLGKIEIAFSKSKSPLGEAWLVAHVKDNGPGMDTSVLARIFDPFFSTKGTKGVGLGLSISYRTIEQHGGLLSVDSRAGEWTEFQVALPLLKETSG